MSVWFWVIVIVFFVARALASRGKGTSSQRNRSQLRQQAQDQRSSASGSAWPFSGSTPNIAPMGQPNSARAPAPQPGPWQPPSSPAAQQADWQDRLADSLEAQINELTDRVPQPEVVQPLQEMPVVSRVPAPPEPAGSSALRERRDIGSAALESTLDSTIESSLFGVSPGPTAESLLPGSLLPGAATVRLPAEMEVTVCAFMDAGQEVAAVRLVCDELKVGIFDAMRSVRQVAGLPIS